MRHNIYFYQFKQHPVVNNEDSKKIVNVYFILGCNISFWAAINKKLAHRTLHILGILQYGRFMYDLSLVFSVTAMFYLYEVYISLGECLELSESAY